MEPTDSNDPHARVERILGPCPVPRDHERYNSWLDIGFVLLEAHARFQAEFIEKSFGASTEELAELTIEATVRQFDMIATVIAATTTDYASAVEREALIVEVSEMVLRWLREKLGSGPRWMQERVSAATARQRLQQRVAHWTAHSLQLARESGKGSVSGQAIARPVQSPSVESATLATAFPNRAAWLQAQLDARRWTVQDLERFGGPASRTTRKILAEEPVKQTVLEKLAQALSVKTPVAVRDIPKS